MPFPLDENTSVLREVNPGTSTSDAHVETEMAALAARFVNSTNRHVFLTGKAGTGKTTFLHKLAASTHKRYVILAPTGIAALNAKGVTIHSQFLLPFGSFLPEKQRPADIPEGAFHDQDTLTRRHPLNAIRRHVLREVDLLIIDEVSMLRADLLDAIDFRMRAVRQNRYQSFGGAQVLLIGDLYQLPPVVKDDEWRVMRRYYTSMHFFESRVIKEYGYAHIELDRIFRQQDGDFINILNNLRNNTVTATDVATLNKYYRSDIDAPDSDGVITLTTHNYKADELNQHALVQLVGRSQSYDAVIEGDFPQGMYPVLERIELKVGAQIMFVKNDMEKAYFNGKLARVEAIGHGGITVRMYEGAGDKLSAGTYLLKRETWENKRYVVDASSHEQKEEVIGTFEQYPIKLAWAITVHKSQGLTFNKAIIDVGQAFAPGQVYVALSRLRS
ncbi:MAG TPA: AAA family ATPase, partial [Flavobacteriales bacterium]|nr:AAA family ATPase [Flavobacteriales bacterium]